MLPLEGNWALKKKKKYQPIVLTCQKGVCFLESLGMKKIDYRSAGPDKHTALAQDLPRLMMHSLTGALSSISPAMSRKCGGGISPSQLEDSDGAEKKTKEHNGEGGGDGDRDEGCGTRERGTERWEIGMLL